MAELSLGVATDLALCWLIVRIFALGAIEFTFLFVGMILYSTLNALKISALEWIIFELYGRAAASTEISELLIADDMPEPRCSSLSAEDYLSGVTEDEHLKPEVCIAAAVALTALKLQSSAGIQAAMRISIIWNEALHKYKFHLSKLK